ncbi:MAG: zf-HC2 domain-containing protein [Deltaproteobacteria bacterium]|nr:zf-HC2 domain-containing protein [Deltaproteobacteria bacterium]
MPDVDHSTFESDFSEFYEHALPEARQKEVQEHLSSCPRCMAEYDKFRNTLGALSGLAKVSAPQAFDEQVAHTIHRRSAGLFFGRKALGDRLPYELIALLVLLLGLAVLLLMRVSQTGTVHEPFKGSAGQEVPRSNNAPPRP